MNRALVTVGVVALIAGCYDPLFVDGLACVEPDYACPPGQMCVDTGGGQLRCHYQNPLDASLTGCTLVPQSGCADTLRCTVNRLHNPTTVCVREGPYNLGEACIGFGQLDECAGGLVCLERLCRKLCIPLVDGSSCSLDEQCIDFLGWSACLPQCDVIAQTCSTVGDVCYMNDIGLTFCIPPESNLNLGAVCTFTSQCGVGMGCHGGICRAYCQLPDDGTCPPNLTCQLAFTNRDNVGLCQ